MSTNNLSIVSNARAPKKIACEKLLKGMYLLNLGTIKWCMCYKAAKEVEIELDPAESQSVKFAWYRYGQEVWILL